MTDSPVSGGAAEVLSTGEKLRYLCAEYVADPMPWRGGAIETAGEIVALVPSLLAELDHLIERERALESALEAARSEGYAAALMEVEAMATGYDLAEMEAAGGQRWANGWSWQTAFATRCEPCEPISRLRSGERPARP